jgi:cytidine deaminase
MNKEWEKLYSEAKNVINPCEVSKNIYVGSVGAAILTSKGNIYTGICIDTSCSLGMCAERNALSTMFTNGEYEVLKVCAVYKDGTVMPPCGACREFMMQLGSNAKNIEILVDNQGKVVKLGTLMPEYCY